MLTLTMASRSSRVGKLTHAKVLKTVFYGERADGLTCGHQHTSARAAKHCIANHKARTSAATPEWRVVRVPAPRGQ